MTNKQIEFFLLSKKGYIKKSPIVTAKAIWKQTESKNMPKSRKEAVADLQRIKEVQAAMRVAKIATESIEDDELMQIYKDILDEKSRPKRRLFFDIETSPNVVFSWRIGNKINLGHDNILTERAIICVCWKWEGENEVHSLEWNRGNDRVLMEKFAKVMNSADEVIGQNSDRFDIKWLRARAIYHGVPLKAKFNSLDTLKMARAGFNFNSFKLDYMGEYLGLGKKIKTDYDLWKDIILANSREAMTKMVTYCKRDVSLLEEVYHKLQEYCPVKKFKYNP